VRSGAKKNYPRIYKIWQGMRQRCNNPNDKDYSDYGERGIKVCNEWEENPMAFVDWALRNGYADNLTIDRENVNGSYCPSNCRWATYTEQARNKRIQKTNKTGYSGVHYEPSRNKYRAVIYVNCKKIDLGRYETVEKAAEARRNGELKHWGKTG
jgi:hypothetical protein